MKVVIVTPYFREDRQLLERCIDSVKAQSRGCSHILVADGHPQNWIDKIGSIRHIKLDRPTGDWGNTPRLIGCNLAMAAGADAIAILDADNWYENDHVESCLSCVNAEFPEDISADVIISERQFRRQDESIMNLPEERDHVDANCYMYLKGAFHIIPHWGLIPKELAHVVDRIIYSVIKNRKLECIRTNKKTVNYLAMYRVLYEFLGEEPPENCKNSADMNSMRAWFLDLNQRQRDVLTRLCGGQIRF